MPHRRVNAFLLGLTLGCLMHTSALAEPTGASLAWTSDEPTVARVRELVLKGEVSRAEELLRPAARDDWKEMLEIIRRLRIDYSLDESAMLEKLRRTMPDATAADLSRWREAGELQHRVLDGRVWYFRREPNNLYRFCADAKQRRLKPPETPAGWTLEQHLADVIAAAEKRPDETALVPIKHRIKYKLTVPAGKGGAKAGSVVRIWLPFPQEFRQQKQVKLIRSDPAPRTVAENGSPHRTLYFELIIADPPKPIEVSAEYEYTCYAWYPQLSDSLAKPLPADWGRKFLDERPPHIAFTPQLKQLVSQIVGDETNPLARARKIFHWIDGNIRYCSEEEYCLIPSFSEKAISARKGDCGIQTMLFITMCRSAGVPARWQSGWETKPVNWNMHDWAEFYVEPWGWLPADMSYGPRKSDDPRIREFYFGHQDSYRMAVNLDYGCPLIPKETSLRSEPADFQRGEVEIDGKNLYFNEWDYDFSFEQSGPS
jgi:transglutaminase-like putative cysteine protease